MKSIFVSIITAAMLSATFICAEPWEFTTDASLSFSQSYYSDNWTGSELGNITWTAGSNSVLERQLSALLHSRTTLELVYGQTHQQRIDDEGNKRWGKPDKSTDKVDLESVMRLTLQVYVDPFISARWESQFLDLRDETETFVFNPHRFTESAGIIRNFITKDNHYLSARLGAAFRQKIDRNVLIEGERETQTTYDGGIEFIGEYMRRFLPRDILYKSKLQVYQALLYSEEDETEDDYWKAVNIYWEHRVTAKIWSVVNAVFFFEMVYDKEEDRSVQYRQTLGLGVFFQLY